MQKNTDVIIQRQRFAIRKYRTSDAALLAKYFGDQQILRNVRGVPGRYTLHDAKKFIAKANRGYRFRALRLHYAVEIDGSLAGGVSISRRGRRAEIGYWLARPYWGRGIMTAIIKEWCRYIVTKHKLNELGGKVFTFNHASARVLQKNGFTFVTRAVHALTIKGKKFDDNIFVKRVRIRT